MKEEQFTQGPLFVSVHEDNNDVVIRDLYAPARITANLSVDRYMLSDEEIKANAELYAASPLLYSALKELVEKVKKHYSITCNMQLAKAEEALSKANPQ